MTIDTTRRDDNLPLLDAKCAVSGRIGSRGAGSRAATAAIWLGCAVVSAIPMATTASAHVKWFVTCNASDDPLPPQAGVHADVLALLGPVRDGALCRVCDRTDEARYISLKAPRSLDRTPA